ncbi:hypothetical protein LCGC14_1794970, partial [marine sediment metagenome]
HFNLEFNIIVELYYKNELAYFNSGFYPFIFHN